MGETRQTSSHSSRKDRVMGYYKVTYRQGNRTIVLNAWMVVRNSEYVKVATALGGLEMKIPSYQVISIKLYPSNRRR